MNLKPRHLPKLPSSVYPGVAFDPHRNSLNLLRLVFAITVIASHATYLGGYMTEPTWAGLTPGRWAVIGFFIISGYLITASRNSRGFGSFIVHRLARIYPGFLTNLLVTVLVFAPVGFYLVNRSLNGYLTTGTQPVQYVLGNVFLKMHSWDVANTPTNVPYAGRWNGPLWTIFFEFCCYVIVGLLLSLPAARRRQQFVIPALFAVSVVLQWQAGPTVAWVQSVSPGTAYDASLLMQLLPSFLAGATIYQLRHHIRLSLPGAVVCAGASLVGIVALPGWGPQLVSPLLGYVIFWVATVAPMPKLLKTQDISYGMYIYGFLVQQTLVLLGVNQLGLLPFTVASVAFTAPLAIASWVAIERPVLTLVRRHPIAWQHSNKPLLVPGLVKVSS
ncbi:MAG: acyltransferase [Propionibacteriaceae bacterium]|nr:acyltransferase [Propionibacteriaceae bacterium]